MRNRIKLAVLGLAGLGILAAAAVAAVALRYAGAVDDPMRGPVIMAAFVATLALLAAGVAAWLLLRRRLLDAADALARDTRTLLQAKQLDRALRVPEAHGLGELPEALAELVHELRGARREAVRAMVTATARVEQEKGWLEVILLELLREAVMVCSVDHRVLLYNRPAAALFRGSHTLGLGRSLFDLVARDPVEHAAERLEYRLKSGHRDLSAPFVCASLDRARLLKARMALIVDQAGATTGYVLTLEDISHELEALSREAGVRQAITRDLRRPLASLMAAAENLVAFPDIEPAQRQAFHEVVLNEGKDIGERLETLGSEYAKRTLASWPLTEIHSPDLFECVARDTEAASGVRVTVQGEPCWLMGDSHALMILLNRLIGHVAEAYGVQEVALAAGTGAAGVHLELRWSGEPVPAERLAEWLDAPLPELAGSTARELLERHGSEPWTQAAGGEVLLRIPLEPPPAQRAPEAPEGSLAPRPEFYDFDLMYAHSITGNLGERRLEELTYVVFDTETTGLRPAAGDEIIAIAAVRLTKGRVLTGETFDHLVNPGRPIPKDSIRFHGITDEQVAGAPAITAVLPSFHAFAGDAVLVAHNAAFDMKFLKLKEAQCGVQFTNPVIDTLLLSLLVDGQDEDHSLDGICERLGITVENRHSALGDAVATAHVLVHLLDRLAALGIETFGDAMSSANMEAEMRFRAANF